MSKLEATAHLFWIWGSTPELSYLAFLLLVVADNKTWLEAGLPFLLYWILSLLRLNDRRGTARPMAEMLQTPAGKPPSLLSKLHPCRGREGRLSVSSPCTLFNPLTWEPKESILRFFNRYYRHLFLQSKIDESPCIFKTTISFAILHIYSR